MAGGITVIFEAGQVNRFGAELESKAPFAKGLAGIAIRRTALAVERDAKVLCPVDTGNLRNSISMSYADLRAEIGPTAYYGVFVEFGTSRMAPEAFMGPSFDRHAHELEAALLKIADL